MTNSVTFDTSGEVFIPDRRFPVGATRIRFSDLSPFCQGFVEAAFASLLDGFSNHERETSLAGFSDLHPSTLARFMEECERALGMDLWGNSVVDGRLFWSERQEELFSGFWGGQQTLLAETLFPKLRLHLSPDGKVMAEEVSKEIAK